MATCECCGTEFQAFGTTRVLGEFPVTTCTGRARDWDRHIRAHPIWKAVIDSDAWGFEAQGRKGTCDYQTAEKYVAWSRQRNALILQMHEIFAAFAPPLTTRRDLTT